VSPEEATEVRKEYPVVVAKFKNLTVVSRPKGCPRNGPAS